LTNFTSRHAECISLLKEKFLEITSDLQNGFTAAALPFASPLALSAQNSLEGGAIVSGLSDVQGAKIHYLKAGSGPAVILLHGYTQTSRMWRPIIPLLARKFAVIAPDLSRIGDSEISKNRVG